MLFSLSEQTAFSFRAGYFLFSSRLYSLSNIPNPSRKDSRTSKSPQPSYKQKPTTFLQVKSTTFLQASSQPSNKQSSHLPTSKLTTIQQAKLTTFLQAKPTTFLQAKPTTFLQAKAHSHTPSLMLKKHSEKRANPAKYPQYSTL